MLFQQNLIFTATTVSDEEISLKIITELIESGVDVFEKDTLRQSPLFYAARDGKCKLI
jgi:ankyrin repeat protein